MRVRVRELCFASCCARVCVLVFGVLCFFRGCVCRRRVRFDVTRPRNCFCVGVSVEGALRAVSTRYERELAHGCAVHRRVRSETIFFLSSFTF